MSATLQPIRVHHKAEALLSKAPLRDIFYRLGWPDNTAL